jgi:hypothetical protein
MHQERPLVRIPHPQTTPQSVCSENGRHRNRPFFLFAHRFYQWLLNIFEIKYKIYISVKNNDRGVFIEKI